MRNILIASIATLALASGAAQAADMGMPLKAPMRAPSPAYSWTGCFLGIGGGYGMSSLRERNVNAAGAGINVAMDEAGQGWLGVGSVGCDYQFSMGNLGNWVIGAFGDGEFADIHGLYTGDGVSVGLQSGDMKEKSEWDAGGRIGYLVTPTLLAYESAGYSSAHFSSSSQITTAGTLAGTVPSATYNGWFLGSGFEYQFTFLPIQGLFLKTEYRYYDYQGKTLTDLSPLGAPNGNFDNVHPHVQTITTELVYRFNWH
jgi:outer membrane immunogenic protein